MRKLIHISPEYPGKKSGGQLCVRQSIIALSKFFQIDYVGPFSEEMVERDRIKNKYFLKPFEASMNKKFFNYLLSKLSVFYPSWKNNAKKIEWQKYDYVYLEFTKWLFVAVEAKKKDKKLIVRVHNIEVDYFYNLLKIEFKFSISLKYLYTQYAEKKVLDLADYIIVLTKNDKQRILELYYDQVKNKEIIVFPICVDKRNESEMLYKREKDGKLNLLITGSLWYGPNYDGVKWFIINVWPQVKNMCNLTVAGSRPTTEMRSLACHENINLVEDPDDMNEYFIAADLYIAPIFSGAGMKVKVAEAFSYGLPVIGTHHAFIGYDVPNLDIRFVADFDYQFVETILAYSNRTLEEIVDIRRVILKYFEDNLSMDKAFKYIQNLDRI